MRLSFDVGECVANAMRDLLQVEAILQALDDDAGRRIEAIDDTTLGIQEDGAVGVVDDVDGW
jgi:hypothetical protein